MKKRLIVLLAVFMLSGCTVTALAANLQTGGGEDWTGWDDEENQELCMNVFAMTEWSEAFEGAELAFLYDVNDHLTYADATTEFRDTLIDEETTIGEYFSASFQMYSELMLAIAYTMTERQTNLARDEHDIFGVRYYLYNAPDEIDSNIMAASLIYNQLSACMAAYRSSHEDHAVIYEKNDALKICIQGLLYGEDYVRTASEYSQSSASQYSEQVPKWYAQKWSGFADDVMSHYGVLEITGHYVIR